MRQTAIIAATVMHLLLLRNVKTAIVAGWDLRVLIRVRLETKFQWTVASVFVGLDTQVKMETLLCIITVSFFMLSSYCDVSFGIVKRDFSLGTELSFLMLSKRKTTCIDRRFMNSSLMV